MVGSSAVHHVLPDNHSETVAMVVPAHRLDLDVLAQHIKACFFCQINVIDKCLVAGGGHQPVRPVALIQQSVKKIRCVVQAEPESAVFVGLDREAAQCKVAVNPVVVRNDGKAVEIGLLRCPEMNGILRKNQPQDIRRGGLALYRHSDQGDGALPGERMGYSVGGCHKVCRRLIYSTGDGRKFFFRA